MKKLLLSIIILLVCCTNTMQAQTLFSVAWSTDYQHTASNGYSNEARKAVVDSISGNVFVLADFTSDINSSGVQVAGSTFSYTSVLKYDSVGTLISSVNFDVGAHSTLGFDYKSGFGIQMDATGNIYIGYMNYDATTNFNVNIRKLNQSLATIWTYNYKPSSKDVGLDLKLNAAGNAFALVKSVNTTNGAVTHNLIKASAGGFATTPFYLFNQGPDYLTSLAMDASGNCYAAGYRQPTGGAKSICVTSVNGTSGAYRWNYVDSCGSGAGDDFARHIIVGSDGNVYITGSTQGNVQHGVDAFTMKLSYTNGKKIWDNYINYTLSDGGFFVANADANYVSVAWSSGSSVYVDQMYVNTGVYSRRANYTPAPVATYTSLGAASIADFMVSPNGNIYLCGTIAASNGTNNFEGAWLIKVNFGARGLFRLENVARIEGDYSNSKRSATLFLDYKNRQVYWIKNTAATNASHQQEKIEVFQLDYTGSFRSGQPDAAAVSLTTYPNPATSFVELQSASGDAIQLDGIYDVTGKMVLSSNDSVSIFEKTRVDLTSLKPGIYFIRYLDNIGKNGQAKILKY